MSEQISYHTVNQTVILLSDYVCVIVGIKSDIFSSHDATVRTMIFKFRVYWNYVDSQLAHIHLSVKRRVNILSCSELDCDSPIRPCPFLANFQVLQLHMHLSWVCHSQCCHGPAKDSPDTGGKGPCSMGCMLKILPAVSSETCQSPWNGYSHKLSFDRNYNQINQKAKLKRQNIATGSSSPSPALHKIFVHSL